MHEKRGVVSEDTPDEQGRRGGKYREGTPVKEAADGREEHATTRLARAAAEAARATQDAK
jgi:hypothetical protein